MKPKHFEKLQYIIPFMMTSILTHIRFKWLKLVCLILLITIPVSTKSQQNSGTQNQHDEVVYQQLIGRSYTDKSLVNKGIFFRNSFLPGKVVFRSGDIIDNVYIRYECLSEKLIWISEGFGQIELDDLSIQSFEIKNSDTTFLFKRKTVKTLNDTTPRFYQIYPDSRIGLSALRKVVIKNSYIKKKKIYIYAPAPIYVFFIEGKEYTLRSSKLKNLYTLFPEKKEAILKQFKNAPYKKKNENEFLSFLQLIEPILLEK